MGGTAAQALTGRPVKVTEERGAIGDDTRNFKLLVTVHPSYLIRLPDPEARERGFETFVADLKLVA